MPIQMITPFLWFDQQAEEAVAFYTSIFANSKLGKIPRYSDAGPGATGSVMTIDFQLEGQSFVALNGGPRFQVHRGGLVRGELPYATGSRRLLGKAVLRWRRSPVRLGKGQVRLSRQVVPTRMFELLSDRDPEKVTRVMKAMFKMTKLDINALQHAYDHP